MRSQGAAIAGRRSGRARSARGAGGLFLPLRDETAGQSSYGGGRYVLDTAKGTDLGGQSGRLIIDLNFLYHPSCRYNDAWLCPRLVI